MTWLLQAEKLSKAQAQFDATWKKYQDAIDVLPEEDRGKKLKPIQVCLPCIPDIDLPSLWAEQLLLPSSL